MHTTRRGFLSRVGGGVSLLYGFHRAFTQTAQRTISVKDFSAKGDGASLDTGPIQQAIDQASRSGGGIVSFPPGQYVTGTILLRSGVTLHLPAGATLLGSLDPAHYRLVEPFVDGVGAPRGYALIGCVEAHNVGLQGQGTIDGRGAALQASGAPGPSAKPFLLLCLRSSNVALHGVTLLNSSAWTMHLLQCSGVTVADITIRSLGLANNDGIDIDSSRSVRVERCTIETGDDAICLKTTSRQPCTEITVKDCTLTTRCAAFKIGTESAGDFSAIHVTDCHVIEANLGAVKILSVDGANIRDVVVERLRVDSADTPIFLRLGARGRTFRPGDTPRPPGTLSGIFIRDIDVKHARRVGILLSGIPGHPIEDVTLERIAIALEGEAVTAIPPDPPELPAAYPEVRMFGSALPAYGVFGRHLRNLRIDQVSVSGIPGDARPEQAFLHRQE